jgi:uncharacterized coiled-coil protein SlyX
MSQKLRSELLDVIAQKDILVAERNDVIAVQDRGIAQQQKLLKLVEEQLRLQGQRKVATPR